MAFGEELVITGLGAVTPIGIGLEAYWDALCSARSGVKRLDVFDADSGLPQPIGGQVCDFDAKQHVKPRKSLKVMSREIQFGFAAADMAMIHAGLDQQRVDPERLGVLFGADLISCELDEIAPCYRACTNGLAFDFDAWGEKAMPALFPLWMLKYLPNMPACHVGIFQDARGPNNTLTLGEVSSLAAFCEAARVIDRGQADVMIVGGTGCRLHATLFYRLGLVDLAPGSANPAAVARPFDADRRGAVRGEGAAAFIIERRSRAIARGAKPLARVLGAGEAFEARSKGQPIRGKAIRAAIRRALSDAALEPQDLGHVNAHGAGTIHEDAVEAQAICDELGDVPVFAPKSYFGSLGAGSGAVELAASVLALGNGMLPPTLNYERPDPACPVNVSRGALAPLRRPTALALNYDPSGQAVAMVLAAVE